MNELLDLLVGRVQQPTAPAPPKKFAPEPDPNHGFMYHPFLQKVSGVGRRGWGASRQADILDGMSLGGKMFRPEDAGDYSLQQYDMATDYFNQPDEMQDLLMKLYNQGLDRQRGDMAAGVDPYSRVR